MNDSERWYSPELLRELLGALICRTSSGNLVWEKVDGYYTHTLKVGDERLALTWDARNSPSTDRDYTVEVNGEVFRGLPAIRELYETCERIIDEAKTLKRDALLIRTIGTVLQGEMQ